MKDNPNYRNNAQPFVIAVPCTITSVGIEHCLRSALENDTIFLIAASLDEARLKILENSYNVIIVNISNTSSQLSEEVKFINWCRMMQPASPVIAYSHNHKPGIINYLSALGVRAIISQFESTNLFSSIVIRALTSKSPIYSPAIKDVMHKSVSSELTCREAQVLEKLFLGYNVSQVARELGRDIRTISSHKRRAMEKLGLHSEKDLHMLGCDLSGK